MSNGFYIGPPPPSETNSAPMTGESRTPAPTRMVRVPDDSCRVCVTYTHCEHHGRCLAECDPDDLRAALSRESASPQTDHGAARTQLREWLTEDESASREEAASSNGRTPALQAENAGSTPAAATNSPGAVAEGDAAAAPYYCEAHQPPHSSCPCCEAVHADDLRREAEARLRVLEQAHERLEGLANVFGRLFAQQSIQGPRIREVWHEMCEALASLHAPEVKPDKQGLVDALKQKLLERAVQAVKLKAEREQMRRAALALANQLPDDIIESIREKWGSTHVAMIKTWRDRVLAEATP